LVFAEFHSNPQSYPALHNYYSKISKCFITESELPPIVCTSKFKTCTRISRKYTRYDQLNNDNVLPQIPQYTKIGDSTEPEWNWSEEGNKERALIGWGKQIESIFVPANVTIYLFSEEYCTGKSIHYCGPVVVNKVDNPEMWNSMITRPTTSCSALEMVRACEKVETIANIAKFNEKRCWYYSPKTKEEQTLNDVDGVTSGLPEQQTLKNGDGITSGLPEEQTLEDAKGERINTIQSIVIPSGLQVWFRMTKNSKENSGGRDYLGPYTGPMRIPKIDGQHFKTITVRKTDSLPDYIRLCTKKSDDYVFCGEITTDLIIEGEIYEIKTVNRISFTSFKTSRHGLEPKFYKESILESVKIPPKKEIYIYRATEDQECIHWKVSGPYGSTKLDSVDENKEKYVAFMLVSIPKKKVKGENEENEENEENLNANIIEDFNAQVLNAHDAQERKCLSKRIIEYNGNDKHDYEPLLKTNLYD